MSALCAYFTLTKLRNRSVFVAIVALVAYTEVTQLTYFFICAEPVVFDI